MVNQDFVDFCQANYRIGRNGIIRNARGVAVVPSKVFEEYEFFAWKSQKSMEGITTESIAEALNSWSQAVVNSSKKEKKETPPTDQIIREYMQEHGDRWVISPTLSTIEARDGENSAQVTAGAIELATAITVWAQNKRGYNVTRDTVKMNLADIALQKKIRLIRDIMAKIAYDASKEEDCNKCIEDIRQLWRITESAEVFRAVIKHVIWLIKRKLLDWPTKWELWLNFFGSAGTGKSTLLRLLFKTVLGDFYDEPTLAIFADMTRERDKFTATYVLNFDELSMGENVNFLSDDALPQSIVTNMKKAITQKDGLFRDLGGQSQSKRRYVFTGISSANKHLYDIIFDESTMRRYFEIHCTFDKSEISPQYYAIKDEIQTRLLDIWRGVDENKNDGYFNESVPEFSEITRIQQNYYPTTTTTSMWIEDQNVVAGGESNTLDMYHEYEDWCKERGYRSKAEKYWLKDVQHILPEAKSIRRNINISYGETPCE